MALPTVSPGMPTRDLGIVSAWSFFNEANMVHASRVGMPTLQEQHAA
jgi:hypothetical protein